MDLNLTRCFICDVTCIAKVKNLGSNIERTLTMPLISVLTKCLRTFVEVENEHFCNECIRKIEEYDNLAKLSLQIETELYKQFKSKPFKSSFLDDEIYVDQNEIRAFLDRGPILKIENNITEQPENGIDLTLKPIPFDEEPVELHGAILIDNINKAVSTECEESTIRTENVEQSKQTEATKETEQSIEQFIEQTEQIEEIEKVEQTDKSNNYYDKQCNEEDSVSISSEKNIIKKPRKMSKVKRMKLKDWKLKSGVPLTCDICGRSYKTKGALGVHMVKHSDQNPHECTICKKVFTQRIGLLRHIPIHTGEQQHQCDICGKRFIHSASFNMHKKMHYNERSKKCNICGSEFRSSSHMTRHMRSHTGERPFECMVCGQKFTQRYNMKTHCKTHHREPNEEKAFKCLICPESFVRREKLNEHLAQMHEAAIDPCPSSLSAN